MCGVAVHECDKKKKEKTFSFRNVNPSVIFTTFHSFSVKRNEKSVFLFLFAKHQSIHLFLEVEVNGGDWFEE
jgi:hypothetical protein